MQIVDMHTGPNTLWQWDTAQQLKVNCAAGNLVHYQTDLAETVYEVTTRTVGTGESAIVVADIPDILLQSACTLKAWTYNTKTTNEHITDDNIFITVLARPKPVGYCCTPIEYRTWDTLLQAMQAALASAQSAAEAAEEAAEHYPYIGANNHWYVWSNGAFVDTGVSAAGPRGIDGHGVPAGGTAGQLLKKKSGADYDTEWSNGGGGAVNSVNGQTGDVVLNYEDVEAAAEEHSHIMEDITDLPSIPTQLAELQDDSTHRLVTDIEKTAWNSKQNIMQVSGEWLANYTLPATYDNTIYLCNADYTGSRPFVFNHWYLLNSDAYEAGFVVFNKTYPAVDTETWASKEWVNSQGYLTEEVISDKEDKFRLDTIPTASSDYTNKIVEYIGNTGSTYTNGYFYKCIYTHIDEDLTVTQIAGDVSLGTITTDKTKFRGRQLTNGTIIFEAIGKPITISASNINTFSFITLNRESGSDICPIQNPSAMAYAWKDTTNDNIYFTNTDVPRALDKLYTTANFSTESGYTFTGTTARSNFEAYWVIQNSTVPIDISNDYGIYFTSSPFVGTKIKAVYTEEVNSYDWQQINVQPNVDISGKLDTSKVKTIQSTTSGDVYDVTYINTKLNEKKNIPSIITSGTNITLADNTEYRLTDVTTLGISFPSGSYECWMSITTASSGTIDISLPQTRYIGDKPTFANGETWELSIKDGVIVAGKVGALQ